MKAPKPLKPVSSLKKQRSLRKRRSLQFQQMEDRRMLIAEGDSFSITRSFDTTGLVGSLSSTVQWGDGSQTSGTVEGAVDNNGPLSIKFEYMGSFFNDAARRNALNDATSAIIERFSDDLAAITPSGILEWTASTTNPVTGGDLNVPNLRVAANQLVIYVGGRNLPGNQIGFGGPGGWGFPGGSFTQEQLDQINDFRDVVRYRGEPGASLSNPTDIGIWGGFITFDADTDWYFGANEDGIGEDQIDFRSVAAHELMHVLGFGVRYTSRNSSFETYATNTTFFGPKARALYGRNVPLSDPGHVDASITSRGQTPVIVPQVPRGERLTVTPLDMAMLDDLGWTIRPSSNAVVTATHTYSDNPDQGSTYPVEVTLRGSQTGSISQSFNSSPVTNVAPTLEVADAQNIIIGERLSLPEVATITDPGYRSNQSTETFTYTINWGDGSEVVTGDATITQHGTSDPAVSTEAFFRGNHTYDSIGTYTVRVSVEDDDGGTASGSFTVSVDPMPTFSLSLDKNEVVENERVATLDVVIPEARSSALQVTVTSSDTSKIASPAARSIPAGSDRVSFPLTIIDDQLLSGDADLMLSVSAAGFEDTEIPIRVLDHETIFSSFTSPIVRENDPTSVKLAVTRSNTNVDEELNVNIRQSGSSVSVGIPNSIMIPAGSRRVLVDVTPTDNDTYQLTQEMSFEVTATGYTSSSVELTLLDDEPPKFQNQQLQFNVNDEGGVTPFDALLIINEMSLRGANIFLDPSGTQPHFFDVDGSYFITPFDALLVINHLSELARQTTPQSEELIDQSLRQTAPILNDLLLADEDEEWEADVDFDVPELN